MQTLYKSTKFELLQLGPKWSVRWNTNNSLKSRDLEMQFLLTPETVFTMYSSLAAVKSSRILAYLYWRKIIFRIYFANQPYHSWWWQKSAAKPICAQKEVLQQMWDSRIHNTREGGEHRKPLTKSFVSNPKGVNKSVCKVQSYRIL
jgi:hypothetical protein